MNPLRVVMNPFTEAFCIHCGEEIFRRALLRSSDLGSWDLVYKLTSNTKLCHGRDMEDVHEPALYCSNIGEGVTQDSETGRLIACTECGTQWVSTALTTQGFGVGALPLHRVPVNGISETEGNTTS